MVLTQPDGMFGVAPAVVRHQSQQALCASVNLLVKLLVITINSRVGASQQYVVLRNFECLHLDLEVCESSNFG